MVTGDAHRLLQRILRHRKRCSLGATRRHIGTAAVEMTRHHEPEPYVQPTSPSSSPSTTPRRNALRDARPFSDFLTDTFNREHDYLRISVTERCNLRCLYCMPEEGIELAPKRELLTTPEIVYLSSIFVSQGVNKIRLTGGEPTVRKDIIPLMQQIGSLRRNGLKELALTTNGISLYRKLDAMVESGLTGVNISLDTLDPFEFQLLTRRPGFDAVMRSIDRIQEMNKLGAGVKLKINAVVMRGLNDHQILPFVEKTRDEDIEVRFIEYMPFGGNRWSQKKMLPYTEMLDIIRQRYPTVHRLRDARNDTSKTWQVPGFKGRVGFITSMTHNFCGTCNRLRITSDGNLKVCLHGNTEVSLRDLLRKEQDGEPLDEEAIERMREVEHDLRRGDAASFAPKQRPTGKERDLLQVIGAAVKRKQAAHAGMGVLENLENRPMIKIGEQIPSSICLRTKSRPTSTKQPWSAIPISLLGPSISTAQVRWYSNITGTSPENESASIQKDGDEQPLPDSSNGFGFRSLRVLFSSTAPSHRYSRLRKGSTSDWGLHRSEGKASVKLDMSRRSERESLHASVPANVKQDGDGQSTLHIRGTETSSPKLSRRPLNASMRGTRPAEDANMEPTLSSSSELHHPIPSRVQPWGVAVPEDNGTQNSLDSTGEPASLHPGLRTILSQDPNQLKEEKIERGQSSLSTASRSQSVSGSDQPLTKPNAEHIQGVEKDEAKQASAQHLTHVTSSGEAHMVDVGEKPATKRVAVAFAVIAFRAPGVAKLVTLQNNKKGDVFSVARIAGIMAAKRTSDLIPLCHPLGISRVDVDLALQTDSETSLFRGFHHCGAVRIHALVECTGPTGVEMEALTAATTAALTVYDMCKAVDRQMHIAYAGVVYKSGGRSGISYQDGWYATNEAKKYFSTKGVEASPRTSQQTPFK